MDAAVVVAGIYHFIRTSTNSMHTNKLFTKMKKKKTFRLIPFDRSTN